MAERKNDLFDKNEGKTKRKTKNKQNESKQNGRKSEKSKSASRKKNGAGYTALLLIFIAVLAILFYLYKGGYFGDFGKTDDKEQPRASGLTDIFKGVSSSESGELKIHFIDVGQGDCILVQFPDGKNMLIDSGDKGAKTRWNKNDAVKTNEQIIFEYLSNVGVDKNITVLLATHADADHISNMAAVLDKYDVSYCLRPSVYYNGANADEFAEEFNSPSSAKKHDDKNTKVYYNYLKAVQNENCGWEYFNYQSDFSQEFVFNGETYNYSVDFLTPLESLGNIGYSDRNDYSPIMWLKYGEFDIVFTGDANVLVENQYLDYIEQNHVENYPQNIEVLKVGHHGSDTSSGERFINLLKPEYAVILLGEGNKYNHPHKKPMDRLKNIGANIYRTDMQGNIVLTVKAGGFDYAFATQNPQKFSLSDLYVCPPRAA